MEKIVVLIDDDADDIEVLRESIRAIDPTVYCIDFNCAEKAMGALLGDLFLPDYIFIDYNLPRINGEQCLTELKRWEKLNRTTFVINSTHMPSDVAERLKRKGATKIFQKPCRIESYVDILKSIFDSSIPVEVSNSRTSL